MIFEVELHAFNGGGRIRHVHVPDNEARRATAREERIPEDYYSRHQPVTREEALAFIRERAAKIKQAEAERPGKASVHHLRGIFRCNPDDPEDKQIADYIASSPRQWLPDQATENDHA